MKKLRYIFIFILLCCTFTFTSCTQNITSFKDEITQLTDAEVVASNFAKEEYTFVGLFKDGKLYLEGAIAPAGEYKVIYVENKEVVNDVYSYPVISSQGKNFAGWYTTENFVSGTRVAETQTKANILYARYITFGEAGLVALVCIGIVFGMLALLWGIVSLFKFIAPKQKAGQPATLPVEYPVQKSFSIVDITDEDMMVAALVATIDYHNETDEDVRVISVKQIG